MPRPTPDEIDDLKDEIESIVRDFLPIYRQVATAEQRERIESVIIDEILLEVDESISAAGDGDDQWGPGEPVEAVDQTVEASTATTTVETEGEDENWDSSKRRLQESERMGPGERRDECIEFLIEHAGQAVDWRDYAVWAGGDAEVRSDCDEIDHGPWASALSSVTSGDNRWLNVDKINGQPMQYLLKRPPKVQNNTRIGRVLKELVRFEGDGVKRDEIATNLSISKQHATEGLSELKRKGLAWCERTGSTREPYTWYPTRYAIERVAPDLEFWED